jgi:hypothetical protein
MFKVDAQMLGAGEGCLGVAPASTQPRRYLQEWQDASRGTAAGGYRQEERNETATLILDYDG